MYHPLYHIKEGRLLFSGAVMRTLSNWTIPTRRKRKKKTMMMIIREMPRERELKCPKPSCSQTYQGGVLKRLRSHIANAHADDPDLEQYQMAVDDARPNKIPQKECESCGKKIAGRAAQMRIHQNSRNCQERDGVL